MEEERKILVDRCAYCGKEFYSLYEFQLKQHKAVHELTCTGQNNTSDVTTPKNYCINCKKEIGLTTRRCKDCWAKKNMDITAKEVQP